MEFSVWAPFAEKKMEVEVNGTRYPMQATAGGWYAANVPEAQPGDRYGYCIDGRDALPDPRSPHQPEGVLGLSALVDHSTFSWTDDDWRPPPFSNAVVYEMHVGTFTEAGTFDAAIEKLDHLVGLGVNYLELMPVNEFPGRQGWGYDGADLYAPHHHYGGPGGLKRLVNACHAKGIAVLLDVVYNHLGPTGNFLGQYGPYFVGGMKTAWGDTVNLAERDSDEVRNFFLDNVTLWLRDYHFDGLRLDAVHAYHDPSPITFLEQMAEMVRELEAHLGRQLAIVAESDANDSRITRSREAGGYGIDAQWNDDYHHAVHAVLTHERWRYYLGYDSIRAIASCLSEGWFFAGKFSPWRARTHGRPATGLSGRHLVGFIQNHDQAGNRALGERINHLISERRLKIGSALVFTAPFVPLIFQGEEWAASTPFLYFTDHEDPDIADAVRKGRKAEFGIEIGGAENVPDPQDPETFEFSKLKWEEQEQQQHREMLGWYRKLIALRRELPSLATGEFRNVETLHSDEEGWLLFYRSFVAVAVNFSEEPRTVPLPRNSNYAVLLTSDTDIRLTQDNVTMPGETVAILEAHPGLGA